MMNNEELQQRYNEFMELKKRQMDEAERRALAQNEVAMNTRRDTSDAQNANSFLANMQAAANKMASVQGQVADDGGFARNTEMLNKGLEQNTDSAQKLAQLADTGADRSQKQYADAQEGALKTQMMIADKESARQQHTQDLDMTRKFQTEQNALKRQELADARSMKEEEKHPSTATGRIQKLNSADKQRLDLVSAGLAAQYGMEEALSNGDWTVKPGMDNKFKVNLRKASEMFGRLQSGGAINKDEEKRFEAMAPGPFDNDEMKQYKLNQMKDIFKDRLNTLGVGEQDLHEVAPNQFAGLQPQKSVSDNGGGLNLGGVQAELERRKQEQSQKKIGSKLTNGEFSTYMKNKGK